MKEPPSHEARRWNYHALLCLLMGPLAAHPAEKVEPIDAEFLEYLAEFEGAEEDWTLFEEEEPRPRPTRADTQGAERKPEAPKPSATEPANRP